MIKQSPLIPALVASVVRSQGAAAARGGVPLWLKQHHKYTVLSQPQTSAKMRSPWLTRGNVSSGKDFQARSKQRAAEARVKAKEASGKLKDLWNKYGVVAIGTYLTTYVVVLGTIYVGMDSGLVPTNIAGSSNKEGEEQQDFDIVASTNRMVGLAEKFGLADILDVQRVDSKTGTFVLAWIATKFTEPVRLAFTLAVTPRIARFLGRAPKK